MTDDQQGKNRGTIFDSPAFEYKGGVRMRSFRAKPSWLPYWERLVLVFWLLGVAAGLQALIDMPLSRFEQAVVAGLGVWFALLGMGVARRRAGNREVVRYRERLRRRWMTFAICTTGMAGWVGLVYLVVR